MRRWWVRKWSEARRPGLRSAAWRGSEAAALRWRRAAVERDVAAVWMWTGAGVP
jgi:hypothetical protein